MLRQIDTIHEGGRSRVVDREKARIFGALCTNPGRSRRELAISLGLRPTSVSALVNELIAGRLVREQPDRSRPSPGRPSLILNPNFNRYVVISFRIVSRELQGTLINLGEEILARRTTAIDARADGNSFLASCSQQVRELLARAPEESSVLGVAFSLVGTVAAPSKVWISAARWPNIRNVHFDALEQECGLPISINRALDTELEYQLAKSEPLRKGNCVLFHWGFGIGSSYAHAGHVLTSTIGRFGEIGHTRIGAGSTKQCLCGETGCLETEAALWAILPDLLRQFPDTPENETLLVEFLRSHQEIIAGHAIENAFQSVKVGLMNLYKLFYPDTILVNGPFIEVGDIFERLARYIKKTAPAFARNRVRIKPVSGGLRGCMFGAMFPLIRSTLRTELTAQTRKPKNQESPIA